MARRRSSTAKTTRGKSEREARAEHLTWAALVLAFALVHLGAGNFANWLLPFAGAVILLISGVYQYSRRWHVSPVTWIAVVILALFAFYSYQVDPNAEFLSESLIVFAGIILLGVITGDT